MFAYFLPKPAYHVYRVRLQTFLEIPAEASDHDIHKLIEVGFRWDRVSAFNDLGLVSFVQGSALKKDGAGVQRLSPKDSDRLFRFAHVVAMAGAIFEDEENTKSWLCKPKNRFSNRSPIAMLSTTPGMWLVEEMLIQLIQGSVFSSERWRPEQI